MPLRESQLIVPALIAMANSPNGEIQTSDLIDAISNQFILDSATASLTQCNSW